MAKEIRFTLSEEEFSLLVNGKQIILIPEEISLPNIKVLLPDIGFERMKQLIQEAEANNK